MNTVYTLIEVTASTVRRGDLIEIGTQQFKVQSTFDMPGAGKRVYFSTGESFVFRRGTRVFAMRAAMRRW
ncbi:hypothetical protein [Streptomyces sp. I05A-00742]|uniref:hypothetical protein n=1 Tax=Streptomyces sp. I05A-00742 TaxID=2732853 RepID=UPI001488230F|nr:hypothetical protein [Streptomyces sp. I05A-00742]